MFILDKFVFRKALAQKGYKSLDSLAKALGMHRNTIQYYLSGQPVISKKLTTVLEELELDPSDVIVKTGSAGSNGHKPNN